MKKNHPKTKHPFRDTFLTKHHIIATFRGGETIPSNILRLWWDKHSAWHQIFGFYTIKGIIENFYLFRFYYGRPQWKLLFKDKTPDDCLALLRRTHRIKKSLKGKHF